MDRKPGALLYNDQYVMSRSVVAHSKVLRRADMRQANDRVVLNIIRQTPYLSRSDLVQITGFPASSVAFIVNRMIGEQLLEEEPLDTSLRRGRRRLGLTLRSDSMFLIGVELANGEATVVAADPHGGILATRRVPVQRNAGLLLARTRDAIAALVAKHGTKRLLGVGVGLTGTVDRATGRVIADENQGWFDVEAGRELSRDIDAGFYFDNDSRLAALAERWFAPPGDRPIQNAVFVMTNRGLGTGVISDGKLLFGTSGAASEFGHTTLFAEGRRCVCGSIGCWEEYASQRAMERQYAERIPPAAGESSPGAAEIVLLARAGDPTAIAVLRQTAKYLGMGFVNLVFAFDPELIVIGGYISAAWDLIESTVRETLHERLAPRYLSRLRIVPSRLGANAVLKGTLALVLSNYFTDTAAPVPHQGR